MDLNENIFAGINYTISKGQEVVLCLLDMQENNLEFLRSAPEDGADNLLLQELLKLSPATVCINAPISLPKAYFTEEKDDYFYRVCDKEMELPSPLLCGELLPKTFHLKDKLRNMAQLELVETYPALLLKEFGITGHDEDSSEEAVRKVLSKLQKEVSVKLDPVQFTDWRALDAFLILFSGYRMRDGNALICGEKEEGIIVI